MPGKLIVRWKYQSFPLAGFNEAPAQSRGNWQVRNTKESYGIADRFARGSVT